MLVHVSRFVDAHNEVHRQVEKYLRETRSMISNGNRETLVRLQSMWESDFLPTTEAVLPTVFGRNIPRLLGSRSWKIWLTPPTRSKS